MLATNYHFHRPTHALTNAEIARVAPSVFADEAHESRGEKYAFIPTAQVLDGLRAEGFEVFNAQQTRCRDENKRAFTKHLLRLRHPDLATTGQVGSEVPEIVLINSHDGTSAYKLLAGFYRCVCANGLVVASSQLDDVSVRHTGRVIDDVIEGSCRVVENLKQIAPVVDQYKGIELAPDEQIVFANAALALRWDTDDQGNSLAPISAIAALQPRRFEDRKTDLFTIYNRLQENLVKGGVRGRGTTGRRTTTRAIGGVNEDVRINRGLWLLTEQFAALKTGWFDADTLTADESRILEAAH